MKTTIKSWMLGCAAGAALLLGAGAGEAAAQQPAGVAARARVQSAAVAAMVAQSSLGNLSVVNQGAVKYRYTRDGVVWDLVNREGSWTRAHAIMIRDALDKLPMSYLRKARASGVDKFYRDADRPIMPLQSIFGIDEASAVAVPMWPFQYVAFSNSSFRSEDAAYSITAHELGHCVHWQLMTSNPGRAISFSDLSWVSVISLIGDNGLKSWNGFTREYARSNFREDFADSAGWYWHSPEGLYAASPAKFRFMRDHVYDGVVPTAAVRLNREAMARVTPRISSLSSNKGVHLAVRDVRGEFFMAPGDGGFNKVRFSQVTALHVPTSRTHMYATVPASCNPSPNWQVTVETQDGKSNAIRFEVEGAWWRFW